MAAQSPARGPVVSGWCRLLHLSAVRLRVLVSVARFPSLAALSRGTQARRSVSSKGPRDFISTKSSPSLLNPATVQTTVAVARAASGEPCGDGEHSLCGEEHLKQFCWPPGREASA